MSKKEEEDDEEEDEEEEEDDDESSTLIYTHRDDVCDVCALPTTTTTAPHESSLVHQLSLPHSHPPSSLDRTRFGLAVLAAHGWDPDARVGLGPPGSEGMRAPLRPREKRDTLGLGIETVGAREAAERRARRMQERKAKGQTAVTNVERRRRDERRMRWDESLREEFYENADAARYLRRGKPWE
jgi:hypothetical protein